MQPEKGSNLGVLYAQKLSSVSQPVGQNTKYLIQKNAQQLIDMCLRELNEFQKTEKEV